eukprot:scaffold185394_cov37-Tisochrysis_lutea.AAC.1
MRLERGCSPPRAATRPSLSSTALPMGGRGGGSGAQAKMAADSSKASAPQRCSESGAPALSTHTKEPLCQRTEAAVGQWSIERK